MKKILIIGASSAIATSVARIYASQGDHLFLIARSGEKLAVLADDLQVRGASAVESFAVDLNEFAEHDELIAKAEQAMGGIDVVLIAHGTLGDQQACEQSVDLTLAEIKTNALSTISLLTLLANHLEGRGRGVIAVISSVAGNRGRQSNYVYGSAKAMVSTFCAGLRNRLAPTGVHVLTIKPGFVDTPMTADIPNKGFLWAQPEEVASAIVTAIEKRKNEVYVPFFWRYIMLIIGHIPEFIFKRLKL